MKLNEFIIGQEFISKSFYVTKEKIQEFANEYDPQFLHIDEEKANQSRFNGIIASGMHTLSISFKLWVEEGKYGEDVIAGTGMNNIKYIKPVFPNDDLHVLVEVIDKKVLKNKTVLLTVLLSTFNGNDEKVLEGNLTALIKQ